MEGGGPDFLCLLTEHFFQSFLKLICRLIGKGDGKNLPRSGRLHGKQVLDVEKCPLIPVKIGLHKPHIPFTGLKGNLFTFVGISVLYDVSDTVYDNGGFSAARTRQNQHGAVYLKDSLLLLIVHIFEVFFYYPFS